MTEAERYLDRIPMWALRKNSLDQVRDFLEEMGSAYEGMRIIHVAGTNGKGSVCAYLTSILREAGYSVGTFISPHLIHVRERFLLNQTPADDRIFLDAFCRVKELAGLMTERGYGPPTYFEFLFYMFMDICDREKPDFVILETGLGGLLDITNAVSHPLLTVITSVSMDHMQYLGTTIREIAAQKAGILKAGVPAVYDGCCPESRRVIEERAKVLGCPVFPVSEKDYELVKREKDGVRILVNTEEGPAEIRISSRADYQMINASVAVRAAGVLKKLKGADISVRHMKQGVEKCFWPGRMEEVLPGVYLDGAHNAGGMKALARTIAGMQEETGKQVSLMFGVVSDKEYHKMIRELCTGLRISRVTIARMDTERSADAESLAYEFKEFLGCPVEAFLTVKEAWEHFLREKGDDLGFCAGSLYLVGEVKALLMSPAEGDEYD